MKEDGETVTKQFLPLFKPLRSARKQIFDEVSAAEDPYQRLEDLVGNHEAYIINFSNCGGGPKTVEFRQHAASMDMHEIFWWVRFCLGMVGLAMINADSGLTCSVRDLGDKIDIEDLLVAVGLDESGLEYYGKKLAQYGDETKYGVYFEEWEEGEQLGYAW